MKGSGKSFGRFLKEQAAAWFSFHRELAYGIWYRLLVRSKGPSFRRLFNAAAWLTRSGVRAAWDPAERRSSARITSCP